MKKNKLKTLDKKITTLNEILSDYNRENIWKTLKKGFTPMANRELVNKILNSN